MTVFQFLEKLPDRVAARMAVLRLDWKHALHQELDWQGFHYSDLCNFRKRLLAHGQESLVFERMVSYLRARGYVKAGGKQRTDATHIVGAIARLSRLEVVWETMRVALNALISHDAPWVLQWLPTSFVEMYSQRCDGYRLSKEAIAVQLQRAGEDSRWLLGQLALHSAPTLQTIPEVRQLQQVWKEQLMATSGGDSNATASE